MKTLRLLIGTGLILLFCSVTAVPVMQITIPTPFMHLNPAASSTITFSVKNVSGGTLPDIVIPKTHFDTPTFIANQVSTTCSGSLANNATCDVVLDVSGAATGNATLSPIVCAFKGAICSHGSILVTVNNTRQALPVTTLATTLPSNVRAGTSYPITATFLNADTLYPMTGITITKTPPDCVKTGDTCQGGILAPLASCFVSYLFTPPTNGSYHLTGTFSYNEGAPIVDSKTVLATTGDVTGAVATPLPTNIEKDKAYPVAFQYSNFGAADITSVVVTPTGFTPTSNTCTGTLAMGDSCYVHGLYTAGASGPVALSTTFNGSSTVVINPVTLVSSSTASDVAITENVSPALPATVTPGVDYPVVFTFTNPNPTLAAERVSIDKLLPNFTETSDTCGATLAAGASCAIGGNFQTADEGPVSLYVIFDHDDNASVISTTSSTASKGDLVAQTTTPLPTTVATNTEHTATFTFTNQGTASATVTGTSLVFPNIVGSATDNCNGQTIAAGANCTISAKFNSAIPGVSAWNATVTYTGGGAGGSTNVEASTSTAAATVAVTGAATTALPANVQFLTGHAFTLTFTNTGTQPANNVRLVTATPHVTGLGGTCSSTTTLAPAATCTVTGTFNSAYVGPYTISATLLYNDNDSVTTSTTTTVHGTPYVYVTNSSGNTVSRCTVNSATGLIIGCLDSGATLMNGPDNLIFSNTYVYINNIGGLNDIVVCTLTSTDLLTGCTGMQGPASAPRGMNLNPTQTRFYVADNYTHIVYVCDIAINGMPINCQNANATTLQAPQVIIFNPAGTRVYITSWDSGNVTMCNVNAADGKFTGCQIILALSGANGVDVNPNGTKLYLTSATGNSVLVCPINTGNGTLGTCVATGSGFSDNHDIKINRSGTRAYVANTGANNVRVCTINQVDGTLSGCTNTGTGFNQPRRVALLNIV